MQSESRHVLTQEERPKRVVDFGVPAVWLCLGIRVLPLCSKKRGTVSKSVNYRHHTAPILRCSWYLMAVAISRRGQDRDRRTSLFDVVREGPAYPLATLSEDPGSAVTWESRATRELSLWPGGRAQNTGLPPRCSSVGTRNQPYRHRPPVSPLRRSRPAPQHPACSPFDERWMGWVPNSDSDATATREETPDKMNGHGMDASVKAAFAIRLLIAMHI